MKYELPTEVPTLPSQELIVWQAQVALRGELRERQEAEMIQGLRKDAVRDRRFQAARYALENLEYCENLVEAAMIAGPVIVHDLVRFEPVMLSPDRESALVDEPAYHPLNVLSGQNFKDQAAGIVLYATLLPASDLSIDQIDELIEIYGEKRGKHLVDSMVRQLFLQNKHFNRRGLREWATSKDGKSIGHYYKDEKQEVRRHLREVEDMKYKYFEYYSRRRRAHKRSNEKKG